LKKSALPLYHSNKINSDFAPERQGTLERFMTIYKMLFASYGKQHWWPAKDSFEMMVGAILTQNTAWTNVEKAIHNFDNRLSPQFILNIDEQALINIIRPAGFFNHKAKRLKTLAKWYESYHFDNTALYERNGDSLREELLALNGVGKETADSILLYAAEKPFFVIDAYTKRIFRRIGFVNTEDYETLRAIFETALPHDAGLFNEYHALIVHHAKLYCSAKPKCAGCPLYNLCISKDIRQV
jgi:endonuclease-3 related protein